MCGRYEIHAHPEVVAMQFALEEAPEFKPCYNVCPGGEILVVRLGREGRRVARHNLWGFGNKLANARGESLLERPAFRDAFRRWRCLVPASGFYEWQALPGRKQPWHFRPADTALFALAGITAMWHGIRSVSLITTQPNEVMAPIHDRMPVVVPEDVWPLWLDPLSDPSELRAHLEPNDDVALLIQPVSRLVRRAF